MNIPLKVYEAFKDDEKKASVLSEAFSYFADSMATLREGVIGKDDAASPQQLENTRLELQLDIEKTRKDLSIEIEKTRKDLSIEIEQTRSELSIEIIQTRKEMKETEGIVMLEIEKTRKEMKEIEGRLSTEIKTIEGNLLKYINRHTLWVIGSVSLIIGALKALDYVLK